MEFKAWPKIQRLDKNTVTITEKIDGTNACVIVDNGQVVGTQSRNRLLTLEDDNMGFANWVEQNKEPLATLGNGYHYGEWAGPGIQKNPHQLDQKTFFLFDPRFHGNFEANPEHPAKEVVSVVPILYTGHYDEIRVLTVLTMLKAGLVGIGEGRETNPEGIIIYFHAFQQHLKRHLDGRKEN
jgi:hypothetical protein